MSEYFSKILEVVEVNGWWIVLLLVTLENLPIVGLLMPGVTVIIFSGYVAGVNDNIITTFSLFFAGVLGVITGDNLAFFVGRFFQNKTAIIKEKVAQNAELIKIINQEKWFVLIWYQFPVYLRMLLPLVMGATNFSVKRWMFINIASSTIFVTTFFIIGMFISKIQSELSRGIDISNYIQMSFFGVFLVWIISIVLKIKKAILTRNTRE